MSRELTPEEIEELRNTPAPEARTDLMCPDCGAPMALKAGKFGRFYGCSTWAETGCGGSHGANFLTGAPVGTPAEARVRRLRKRVMQAAEDFDNGNYDFDFESIGELPEGRVANWGEAECVQALRALGAPVTQYDLLALDADPLELNEA